MEIDYKKEQYLLSVLDTAAKTGFHNQGEVISVGLTVFAVQFRELYTLLNDSVSVSVLMAYLVEMAIPKSRALVWLKNEIDYEILVARGGDRKQIAGAALNALPVNDLALDLYNDRINRAAVVSKVK